MKSEVLDERGYSQLWTKSPSLVVRSNRRSMLLADALEITPGGSILEIGSGEGTKAPVVAHATGCRVTGLDLSPEFTRRATETFGHEPGVDFRCGKVAELAEQTPATYDAIYGDGILHHLIYDLDRSLELFLRLLKPGGTVAFLEPNKANPYVFGIFNIERLRVIAHLEPDEMAFTKSFIGGKFERAGFGDVHVHNRDFLIPGTPSWAVRPLIRVSTWAEKTPGVRVLSQSVLVTARA